MKNNKGITLISLSVYVIGMIAVIAITAALLSFYNKNVTRMNNTSDVNIELNKFEAKMIGETQILGNYITEINGNKMKFSSGNTYTFQDNKIYQNKITVSNYIEDFLAYTETDANKQLLRVYITLKKGDTEIVKNLTYVMEKKSGNETTNFTQVIPGGT